MKTVAKVVVQRIKEILAEKICRCTVRKDYRFVTRYDANFDAGG